VSDLRDIISRELLPFVGRPAQYVGGEINSVTKDWAATPLKFCLAFPDTYAIGASHHGSAILYELLNARADTLCERAYLPWMDAQARMREADIPLFSWESRRAIRDFDILGVSLQYELLYTGALNLLDLAGIPLRAAERSELDPIVLAGGPGTNNPEPMAPFFDLLLLGDGEEALPALLDAYLELRRVEPKLPRAEMITRLAERFNFLYAPAFYESADTGPARPAGLRPTRLGLPERIRAAHVADLEAVPAPVRPVIPYAEVVHDRLTIEIMRGCPRRCRFCESGFTRGKVRLRSPQKVLEIARAGIAATGYEEISLLSLSSSDHPELREILRLLDDEFRGRQVSIALPSLRTSEQLAELPALLTVGRKSGLTLVPEAATARLREAIGKEADEGPLLAAAREAFRRGWMSIKLYFMVGLPGERPEDIDAIIGLAVRIAQLRREFEKGPGHINVSVATLIPRPHTPLQWHGMVDEAYMQSARARLRDLARRHKFIHLKFHHIERSVLEGVLSRGDRRMAAAIEAAYRRGARFDAWDETFDFALWRAAFDEAGVDPAACAHRRRPADEPLPWSHVDMGSEAAFLRRQYEATCAALQGSGESAPPAGEQHD